MTRLLNRSTQVLLDLGVLSLALWVAFFTRFDWDPPFLMFKRLVFVWPYVVGFQYLVLAAFGVPRFAWRYVGLFEITRIFAALASSAAMLLLARIISAQLTDAVPHAQYVLIPMGVILIDFALVFLGISGIRVLRRMIAERTTSKQRSRERTEAVPTILIGAGQAGVLVAKELSQRPDLGLQPVGFLDDDHAKLGMEVHGLRVLGATEQLAELCSRHGATQALITIANAPGKDIRRISELCLAEGIKPKIIPGIYEIVGGQVNLSRIRELDIEDLLGREPVELDESALFDELRGRVVLVTGAGGSIGSELCRQACRFDPAAVVLVEQAENALFEIHRELAHSHHDVPLHPCVADICDGKRMDWIFDEYRPSVVLHAAAHKHVPMMEWNPQEAIKNNVLGTRCLADTAHRHGIDAFVMISTDKAVNPTSVMGASKRVAEMYAQALAATSKTRFVTVRFGNVLGSAGSVIPIFKEQIAKGGPVTVTHPDMTRYFMTIPEACQLVLQASTMGRGGEIFILDMGEPVKIVNLARDLIELSGLVPNEDISIEFTGVRPGEKLFEEIAVTEENADKTRHPKIFVGRGQPPSMPDVQAAIEELKRDVDRATDEQLRQRLAQIVPEYSGSRNGGNGRTEQASASLRAVSAHYTPPRRMASTGPTAALKERDV